MVIGLERGRKPTASLFRAVSGVVFTHALTRPQPLTQRERRIKPCQDLRGNRSMIRLFSSHRSASIVLPGHKRGLSVWQNDGGQNDEDQPESGFECRLDTRPQPFTQRRGKPSRVKT